VNVRPALTAGWLARRGAVSIAAARHRALCHAACLNVTAAFYLTFPKRVGVCAHMTEAPASQALYMSSMRLGGQAGGTGFTRRFPTSWSKHCPACQTCDAFMAFINPEHQHLGREDNPHPQSDRWKSQLLQQGRANLNTACKHGLIVHVIFFFTKMCVFNVENCN